MQERQQKKYINYTTKMQNEKNGMKFMSEKWCHKMHSHTLTRTASFQFTMCSACEKYERSVKKALEELNDEN